jgi:hypothetical protein
MACREAPNAQRFFERLECFADRSCLARSAIVCRRSEIVERRRSRLDDAAVRCERDPVVLVFFRPPGVGTVSRCTSLMKLLGRPAEVLFAMDSPYEPVSFKWRSGGTIGAAGE